MERGTLIGGGLVVVLLGAFAGLFLMLNMDDTPPATAGSNDPPPAEGARSDEGRALAIPAGAAPTPGATGAGDAAAPDPDGAGADKEGPPADPFTAEQWDEIRARKAAERQARAYDVLDTFAAGKSEAEVAAVRDAFDHLFATSAAVRDDVQNGRITLQQSRSELSRLREHSIRTITEAVGGEEFNRLREDLRKRDASLF